VSDRDIVQQLSEIGVKPAEVKRRLEAVLEKWFEHRKENHRWEKTPPDKFRLELEVRAGAFLHNRRWTGFKPKKMKAQAVNKFLRLYKSWFHAQAAQERLDIPTRARRRPSRGSRLAERFKRQR
jgi:hypothetical protein